MEVAIGQSRSSPCLPPFLSLVQIKLGRWPCAAGRVLFQNVDCLLRDIAAQFAAEQSIDQQLAQAVLYRIGDGFEPMKISIHRRAVRDIKSKNAATAHDVAEHRRAEQIDGLASLRGLPNAHAK